MKQFDEKIRKRMIQDHNIDLSSHTMSVLRKSIELKIINMIKRVEILHLPGMEIFPQYSKKYNAKRVRKEKRLMGKLRKVDPSI